MGSPYPSSPGEDARWLVRRIRGVGRLLTRVLACGVFGLAAAWVVYSAVERASRTPPSEETCPGVTSARDFLAPHLGFRPALGWQTKRTGNHLVEATWALSSTRPVAVGGYGGYLLIPRLAPGQILIVVDAYTSQRGQSASVYSRGVRVRCLPLRVSDATVEAGWEGQPRPSIPQYQLLAWVNHQLLDTKVFFPTQNPPGRELAHAQHELDRLRIPARPTHPSLPSGVPEPPLS